jgi:hypothetical protein
MSRSLMALDLGDGVLGEACHRPNASAETRAYLASDRTEVCPDSAMSIGVEALASAAWVSAAKVP